VPLWYDLEEPHKYLYHYTTRQAALGSILPKAELRVGLYRYMNDPRESKDWQFTLEGGSAGDLIPVSKEATRVAKATAKVLALVRDDPTAAAGDGFGEFGRGYAHSALWSHYAGGHSGVCLVFDREALRRAVEDTLLSKGHLYAGCVTYADADADEVDAFTLSQADINRLGVPAAVEAHIQKWHPVLFFRKSREWENEREYRWVLRSPDPVAEFVPIADALRGLVLGDSFPPLDRDSVDHLAKTFRDLSLAICRWESGVPKIYPQGGPAGAISLNVRFRIAGERPPPPSLEVAPPI
jgi:hypothetical protein